MPVSFDNSTSVSARTPDGRWFDVRIVPDDGHRPWPRALFVGRAFVLVFGSLYAVYRAALRVWYGLRRSTKKAIEVIPWGDGNSPPPDRSRPVLRESRADDASARVSAKEVHAALVRGDLLGGT